MSTQGNHRLLSDTHGYAHEGSAHVVIVRTSWNADILDALEGGCRNVLASKGVADVRTLNVPGAVEIPFAIRQSWESMKYRDAKPAAYIALGCIIKGDTPHFDHVCNIVSQGVLQLNLMLPVPTVFGVLTVNTPEQAWERLGGIHGHKGEEAAHTALSMVALVRDLQRKR